MNDVLRKKAGEPEDPQPGLGAAIRHLRKQAGIGQEELATKADLSPSHFCRIEAGEVSPKWGSMRAVAEALGVDLAWLAYEAEKFERRQGTTPTTLIAARRVSE